MYGPGGLPVEQINNSTGTVEYLHHDQQGSTRLLTGSTGTITGKCTYSAYGTPEHTGTATTPLGYVEQINSENHVQYLHHDQQGSTRLITGETGKTEGAYTYSPYGVPEHTGTATTPFGYDAQYACSDTGLIYMRARVYDPATAQFLTVDPLEAISGAPYNYAGHNPVNREDAVGLLWTPIAGGADGADAVRKSSFRTGRAWEYEKRPRRVAPQFDINQDGTQYKIHVAE
jgi:RHS repeat-associated protein